MAKSKPYQSAADAPETLRAYKTDVDNFSAWREAHSFRPLAAEPETVGANLAAAGLGLSCCREKPAALHTVSGIQSDALLLTGRSV